MILISFSSVEDDVFNDVKNMTFLARNILKISHSALFGTPGIGETNKKKKTFCIKY